ncbi:hypothetical protein QMO17_35255, partial [Klebsiella pneumoniae]|nr:hypothetical protein [Klebsiella pneumoniae]
VYGATLKSVDSTEATKVPGVLRVVRIPAAPLPAGFQPLGGVAVIATNTWAAMQGRQKLKLEWNLGPNGTYDSGAYRKALEDTARQPGKVVRNNGDTAGTLKNAAKHVSADYYV